MTLNPNVERNPKSESRSDGRSRQQTVEARLLEVAVGREQVDKAVQNYFSKWKFRHPQPEDMKAAFEETVGARLDKFFELTKKEGKLE